MSMKFLFLIFFLFFAHSEEKSTVENSEERILFTVEDTPKSTSQEFFTIKEKENLLSEEQAVSSESFQAPEPPELIDEPDIAPSLLEEISSISDTQNPPKEPVVVSEQDTPPLIEVEEDGVELAFFKPQVDILIVVDNSGSMKFILEDIGRKMQTFEKNSPSFGLSDCLFKCRSDCRSGETFNGLRAGWSNFLHSKNF